MIYLKIPTITWSIKFILPQKINELLAEHTKITRLDNYYKRLVFKIEDGYKLELQTPKSMKLFANTKKIIDKTKIGVNVPNFEVVEVLLVQCNLVDYL